MPVELFLGLLTRRPDPDGHGYLEVDAPGYGRVYVDLVGRTHDRLAVAQSVTFELSAGVSVSHVALYDARYGGELCWYGGLKAWRYAQTPATSLKFPPYSLLAKRLPAPTIIYHRGS